MITAYINNKKIINWTSLVVSRSIDNAVGSFDFGTDNMGIDTVEGQAIQIFVDDEPRLKGYIENPSAENAGSTGKTIRGRDVLGDLIDSSLPDACKKWKSGSSLIGIITKVLKELSITATVINEAGTITPFQSLELTAGSVGQNAFEYVSSLARKRAVFINTDGEGNLVLFKMLPVTLKRLESESIKIVNGDFLESSINVNTSDRYGTYCCKSQAQMDSSYTGDAVFRKGFAYDETIRSSRYYEFVAEESMTNAECKARAEEECDVRRLRSVEVRLKMQGHSFKGKVFDIKQIIFFVDTKLGVTGVFLVKDITFTSGLSGNYTDMTLTYPNSYAMSADIDQKALNKTDITKYLKEKKNA